MGTRTILIVAAYHQLFWCNPHNQQGFINPGLTWLMILVHFLSGPWSAKFSVRTIRWRNQELLCFWSTCKRQRLQIYEDMFVWQVSHVQKKLVTQVLHAPLQKIETIDYVTHTSSCSNCSTSCSKSIVDVNMSQNWRANMIRCALVGLSVSWGVNPQLQGRWMSFLPIFLAHWWSPYQIWIGLYLPYPTSGSLQCSDSPQFLEFP